MADITVSGVFVEQQKGIVKATWTGFTATGFGTPFDAAYLSDKSIQVYGTTGTGGVITIEGSNVGATGAYTTLSDPNGNDISGKDAEDNAESVLENMQYIRPRCTAAGSLTDLNVVILARADIR